MLFRSCNPRLLICAATLGAVIFFASAASAQSFRPDLSETLEWINPPMPIAAPIPADAPALVRYPMPAEPIRELQSELTGRPFHVLDPPPESFAWWKTPIYVALGLPRDVVDGLVGVVSYVPIINIPIVGVGYEIVPTQIFLRDPRDWHRWPGVSNRRGHGFFPRRNQIRVPANWENDRYAPEKIGKAWHLEESWGFFPTLNSVHWRYVSRRRMRKLGEENVSIEIALQVVNGEINEGNIRIAERQHKARKAAVEAIDQGKGFEATSRMLPYHLAYPNDETALALLINSLAVYAADGPNWVRPWMYQSISGSGQRVVRQAATLLDKSFGDYPERYEIAEALAYARATLDEHDQALRVAEITFRADRSDLRRARLYFEAGMGARDRDAAREALDTLSGARLTEAEIELMELRLDVLEGNGYSAWPRLAELVAENPDNPYYRYYLGAAALSILDETDEPEEAIQVAFDELERSSLMARSDFLRERVSRALTYARGLAADEVNGGRERRPRGRGAFMSLPQ